MLKSKKNIFWEALLVTIVVFLMGLFLGMLIETDNSNKISGLYLRSEISLTDGATLLRLSEDLNLSCEDLKRSNIDLANRIYREAKMLENYDSSEKLTGNIKLLHKKYDLLRTLLWMSNQESLKRCDNYDLIVYLYEYESKDAVKKATQNVWSKILLDATGGGNNVLLLPIAADQNLTSLNLLMESRGVTRLPAVIVNNEKVLYDLKNVSEIESLLH